MMFLVSSLHASVQVTFPTHDRHGHAFSNQRIPVAQQPQGPLRPVYIDDIIVYYSGKHYHDFKIHKKEKFDLIREDMTLKEIVSLLGPGARDNEEGIGFITWRCEDQRRLKVYPFSLPGEKPEYSVHLHGRALRNGDVKKLIEELIVNLDINAQEISITLTQDTHQAKANEAMTYSVGETFQKVEPLPRIDLKISKIEENLVHCSYYYQAPQEGLMRYSQSGTLTLEP
jgi:hypothetical protein